MAPNAADLRQANQTLADREQRLRLAIATGRIGLWIWNSSDVANAGDWSPRLKEIFGLPLDAEVTHEMFLERVHPEDRERVNAGVMQALTGADDGEYACEYRAVRGTDGALRWLTARGQAFFDAAQLPVRFIGTVMDFTERKLAEETALRRNCELDQRIAARTAELEHANRALELEIDERKRAEAAMRASEHLARGQLEALTQTLEALSKESEPEKFLVHVLHMIVRQLSAHSLSVWEMNEGTGRVELIGTCEDGRMHFATEEEGSGTTPVTLPLRDHPVWTEFFRNGRQCVIGDMEAAPPLVQLTGGADWHYWVGDAVMNRAMFAAQNRFKELGIAATLCVPLVVAAKVTGFISIRFVEKRAFGSSDFELARALAHQATLALQVLRLSQQSRQAAIIAERSRMSRDLHDTLAQGFTGIIMQLQAAKGAASRGGLADAEVHIDRAEELARASLGEARLSMRALRSLSTSGGTLCMALADLLKRMTDGTQLKAELLVTGEPRLLPLAWEDDLLRIAQEALTNTIKHARARHFQLRLGYDAESIRLQLADDGSGFDPDAEHEGLGLIGMRERVDRLGGHFRMRTDSAASTEIEVVLSSPGEINAGHSPTNGY